MLDHRPILGFFLVASIALASCDSSSSSTSNLGAPPNVVLICMDTVRADHLGCYGYERDTTPFLDVLAAKGTRFADTSAAASWTKPSVPSFLTGTMPCQHGVYEGSARLETGTVTDVLPERALTLAEVFKEEGYRTGAFVHNAQLRYGNGFEQGFDRYAQESWDAREIRWRGSDWLDESDQPFFLYLHFLDAHWPYPAPDAYATRYGDAESIAPFRGRGSKSLRSALNSGAIEMTQAHRDGLVALYDGSLRYIDDNLKAFHAGLVRRGMAENTILCVLSDHGEEFGEHGYIGHGNGLYEGLLSVPWILYVPGQSARLVRHPVSLIDMFPTLLSAAGIPVPDGLPGVNRMEHPDTLNPILAEHKEGGIYYQALRESDTKLLRALIGPKRIVRGLSPFVVGERWEAEFEVREDGTYRALQMKPDGDDPDDPLELKGHIESPEQASFRLGDIRVLFDEGTRRQLADGVRDDQFTPGRLVKVRGFFQDGVLRAERIKCYARSETNPLEIRGKLQELEDEDGVGRVRIADLWIHFDHELELKGGFKGPKIKRVLERDHIVQLLEDGEGAQQALDVTEEIEIYDLEQDPMELSGVGAENARRAQLLRVLLANLVKKRVFEVSDRLLLTPEAVQDLRDIGYAE